MILDNYRVALRLDQPVFTGFALTNAYHAASEIARAQREQINSDSLDAAYQIRVAYWSLYLARATVKVFDESIKAVSSHLKDVQNLFEQGLATQNDVLKVQTELDRIQLNQIDAVNSARIAEISLAKLLHTDPGVAIATTSRPDSAPNHSPGMDSILAVGMSQRAELASMRHRVKAARHGVAIANSGWYPKLAIAGNYYYMRPNSRILPARDEWNDTWDVGVYMSFDLWNWGQTARKAQKAKADVGIAEDALSRLEDAIEIEITRAYLDVRSSAQSVTVARAGVAHAEENSRVTSEMFKNGLATSSDLLDAEIALEKANIDLNKALVDNTLAWARLEKSIGE
jgi:outer membrane protein TolC